MTNQTDAGLPHSLNVRLEFIADDPSAPDPATVGAAAREVAATLRQKGYTAQPAYTGERGGPTYDLLLHLGQDVETAKAILLALFELTAPVLGLLGARRLERRAQEHEHTEREQAPLVVIEVDGAPVTIIVDSGQSPTQQAEKLMSTHPEVAARLNAQTTIKVRSHVPTTPPRRRR